MTVLPLRYAPDPILLRKTRLVKEIDDDISRLVDDMIETMHHEGGVGLAAPQVNRSIQIVVLEYAENKRYPGEISIPLTVLVNPILSDYSKETKDGLSLIHI